MTSKDHLVCQGKQAFDSYAEAMRNRPKKQDTLPRQSLRPYKCHSCRKWHNGHSEKIVRRKTYQRRKKAIVAAPTGRLKLPCGHGDNIWDCPKCKKIRESVLGVK